MKGSGQAIDTILPIYACYGQELYLLDEFLRKRVDRWIQPEYRDFAISKYDLQETPLDAVLDDAETAPFMVDHKVIIANQAVFLTGAKVNSKVEHNLERLLQYMEKPAEDTVIFFIVHADKLDERKKIVKRMKEKKWLFAFQALANDDLERWVERQVKSYDLIIDRDAIALLLLYTGAQLQALSSELEKLALYAGRGGTITTNEIELLVSISIEQNIFLLIEHIVQRRLDQAIHLLDELLKQKEEPIRIVLLIARQFRMMLQIQYLAKQGYSHQQMAGQIGAHPYAVKIAGEQARKYSAEKLQDILSAIAVLDYEMKSGRVDKIFGLEMLMLRICQPLQKA